MSESGAIIGLAHWLQTPGGRYLLAWEQARLDEAVADIFGFHALQLGLPELDALRGNRMPHRWLALEADTTISAPSPGKVPAAALLRCDFDALPLDSQSLDLVVLPHTLEFARDAHLALREVERVLRPEGRAVILGFNPHSLWGLRQGLGHLRRRVAPRSVRALFLPSAGDLIGHRRLRDWLRLLSFEVEGEHFGCYRPPFDSAQWLARLGWLEPAGERWWPVFGAVYCVVAVKRVRGMRLVGLARDRRALPKAAAVVIGNSNQDSA
jgi:SAM-dependent methyltransferase